MRPARIRDAIAADARSSAFQCGSARFPHPRRARVMHPDRRAMKYGSPVILRGFRRPMHARAPSVRSAFAPRPPAKKEPPRLRGRRLAVGGAVSGEPAPGAKPRRQSASPKTTRPKTKNTRALRDPEPRRQSASRKTRRPRVEEPRALHDPEWPLNRRVRLKAQRPRSPRDRARPNPAATTASVAGTNTASAAGTETKSNHQDPQPEHVEPADSNLG